MCAKTTISWTVTIKATTKAYTELINRIHLLIWLQQICNKMPRSFLIKKKEKMPRSDREEREDITPIVTPRTVYDPTPSRLEQLAAIVTGAPLHYLPTYPVSPFTPLAVSLANGKWIIILKISFRGGHLLSCKILLSNVTSWHEFFCHKRCWHLDISFKSIISIFVHEAAAMTYQYHWVPLVISCEAA